MATKATAKVTNFPDKLERHPLSDKYGPKMSDEELTGLGKDIKANGQHEDIILHEGMVLAGWNRYMGAIQQGVKPRTKPMEKGANPVAVAFGTNFMRRRLSSVQKAYYGAKYALDTGEKQADVAKMMGCSLNRLNQCVQLLKAGTDDSKQAIESLENNPEMSGGSFDEMMLEVGIARPAAPAPSPARTNTHSDDSDDDLPIGDDDLTGGAIDDLLGDDAGDDATTTPRQRREIGEGSAPLPLTGSKPPSGTNPHETPTSRVAKAFKGLSADEQRNFVRFAWQKLQIALNAAITKGEVQYTAPEHIPTPAPDKKPKGKAAKAAAASTPPDPSLIARNKPAEDEPAKKAPAAKKTAPAKKAAPAKKSAKK